MTKIIPPVGSVFGLLTVIGEPFSKNGLQYPVRCKCGHEFTANITLLNSKVRTNGGCQKCAKGRIGKHNHGSSRNPTYSKYQAMKQRCMNPNNKSYRDYGAKGIKVCDRWMLFENFLADMGECPGAGYSIDRKDSKGDYCPENCRWATAQMQAENTSLCRPIEFRGVTYPTIESAAKAFGIKGHTLRARLFEYGWSLEKALTSKTDKRFHHKVKPKE